MAYIVKDHYNVVRPAVPSAEPAKPDTGRTLGLGAIRVGIPSARRTAWLT